MYLKNPKKNITIILLGKLRLLRCYYRLLLEFFYLSFTVPPSNILAFISLNIMSFVRRFVTMFTALIKRFILMFDCRIKAFEEILEQDIIDIGHLRKLAFNGKYFLIFSYKE